jgi:phage tail sheath protein FI
MAFQLSPGVNVTEKDLTTIVPTVATTAAGMAGLFEWGPVGLPVTIGSVQELGTLFGMPKDGNAEWWFTAYNYLGYGNNLKIVRHVGDIARNATMGTKTPALIKTVDSASVSSVATVSANGSFVARYPGELGNSLWVDICGSSLTASGEGATFGSWIWRSLFNGRPTSSSYSERLGIAENDAFHMVVVDYDGKFTGTPLTVLEKYENISIHPGAVNSDGTPLFYKTKINDESRYVVAVGDSSFDSANFSSGMTAYGNHTATWTNGTSYQSGGSYYARLSGGTGQFSGVSDIVGMTDVGYQVFADADTIDVNLLMAGPLTGNMAQQVCDLAKSRKDCVAFVSSPNKNPAESSTSKINNCLSLRNSIGNNNYAFIDSGYKYMYDPFNDTYRYIPLNGDVAGLCARGDITNDPWYSPAGFNRGQVRNVIKLAFNPTKTERDTIYASAINPIVTFSGEGTVLYGDKTAQTRPSAFDRINVRRLFIVLEKAIATAAKYSLFEFNDAFTRSQFRALVEPFLRDVQARRGITDFKVVCDEKNNTPQIIDNNQFVADIYVKPNRSINFIQLNFVATKTGVSFEEVGA